MNLTALQLFQHSPHSPAALNPSDITNMAIGQNPVTTISTFFLDGAVRLPQYDHRTELDNSHWLYRAVLLMQGVAPPHVRSFSQASRLPEDAAALGGLFPNRPVGQLGSLVLHCQPCEALCWIWSVGHDELVGLCWLFIIKLSLVAVSSC
jgi:hypothetical protein